MEHKWVPLNDHAPEKVEELAKSLNVAKAIARVLLNRGIDDFDKAKRFFRVSIDQLYDPFIMRDMDKAVRRIQTAIEKNEKIFIFGDYDVDGITSVSMMVLAFRELGVKVGYYIPDRLREGYGLSKQGIEEAAKNGHSLIISVDCGITAIDEIKLANSLGIDVIVSDHHEPGPELPPAFATLNPKRDDCDYPFKELAGVGVAYKLMQGLFRALEIPDERLQQFTELVAIGSAADIVPLIDENRIFVRDGLERLMQSKNVGLQALLESTGLRNKSLGTGQIVFIVAPRINAVGRMGDAERAVRLLTTDSPQQARNIASILEKENRERKNVDEITFKQALDIIEQEHDPVKEKTLVLHAEGWHPGVIGIVASRIVEKYYRPTIMISTDNGIGKGSARSIQGFDLYRALCECSDMMLGFGGHKYAAGMKIETGQIESFKEKFEEVAEKSLDEDILTPKLRIDSDIRLGEINDRFFTILQMLGPFGPQNMRPVFVAHNLQIVGTPAIVGNNHLKLRVRQDNVVLEAIGFNLGDLQHRIEPGANNLDIAFVVEKNEWQGRTTIQLRLRDLR